MTSSHHYFTSVSRGLVPGHSSVLVAGHSADVTTSDGSLWEGGGIYVPPTAATILKISSSDANDTSAGAGARTVTLTGLDANYAEITETVALSGQTVVDTTSAFLRTNRFEVSTVGSGGANAGAIYAGVGVVTAGVPATKYGVMLIGDNFSFTSHYTVPAGYTAFVHGVFYASTASKTLDVLAVVAAEGGPYVPFYRGHTYEVPFDHKFESPHSISEKSDLDLRAAFDVGSSSVSGGFEIVLIENGL